MINGPVSSIFDIATFLVLVYGFRLASPIFGGSADIIENQAAFNAA